MGHGHLDRAGLQHLGPQRGHFKHLFVADLGQAPRLALDPRIGRVDAVHVGIDVARALHRRGDGHGAGVRAAPAQGGDALVGVTPWKPAMTAISPAAKQASRLAGGMSSMRALPWASVGDDRHLPAQERAGLVAHVAQGHGQQTGRHLLARGDDGVVLVVRFRETLRGAARTVGPGDQLVGLARHRRDDHRHLLARRDLGGDQARHPTDALQVGHRRAAELHHQPRHVPVTSKTGQFLRGTRRDGPARASRRLLATLMRRRNAPPWF
jgi:hypothetical protein